MSASTPASQTAAAIGARRATTEAMLGRIRNTLKQMRRERAPVTVAAVARHANVSRTFLYQNPAARSLVADAAAMAGDQRLLDRAEQAAHIEAPWRERALNAEDALKQAHQEVTIQRTTIAGLLGKNVRQLTQDNQRLNERLQGARDNNRFLDKRIADLETQLVADGTDLGIHRTTNTRSQREMSASPSAE